MRKLLAVVLLVLACEASASETARQAVLGRMYTANDYFGFIGETADPFTCSASTIRSTYYNTGSNVIYFCNGTSWTALGGATSPLAGDFVATGKWTFGSAADAAGSVRLGETASCVVLEGSSADAFETSLCAVNPTADATFNLPAFTAATYTLGTLTGAETLTNKTLTSPLIGTSLLPTGTGTPLGTTTTPFSNIVMHMSGTYGTGSFTFAGTPTGNRVATFWGDSSDTIVGVAATQSLTNKTISSTTNSISGPILKASTGTTDNTFFCLRGVSDTCMRHSTAMTPDATVFSADATSGSWHFVEDGDSGVDFQNCSAGTSMATNPTICIHSADGASTTKWVDFRHDGAQGIFQTGLGPLKLFPATGILFVAGATAPTVSACGTTPGTVAGSSTAGRVTTGSGGTVQSCTLTFATAYAVAPACLCNDETTILLVRATATTTTLVCDSAVAGTLASQVLTYHCIEGS